MTLHPGDVIPPIYMDPAKQAEVVRWLIAQALPGALKVRLLKGWFITVGVAFDGRALSEVEHSGT